MPKPTPDQIRAAGRQLQRGGILGRGSSTKADKLVKAAGDDGDKVAAQILNAAVGFKPRPWAR